MAVVVAETQAAAAAASEDDNASRPPLASSAAKVLDPQLLMAARRGDCDLLKELLKLNKDEDHAHAMVEEAAALSSSSEVVIVDVVPGRRRHSPAAAPPPSPPTSTCSSSRFVAALPRAPHHVVDGVTLEGDTLLHVVAACGDTHEYLDCAKMLVRDKMHKQGGAAAARLALEARNRKGDTPLHRAAGAGNANMIDCLTDLIASTADDDEGAGAAAKKAFLRMQNGVGETALHQAIRAADNKLKVACIDQLLAMDPELACIPHHDQGDEDDAGASPLYLAISLGEVEIARHLYVKSNGNLSYSGPDGRNVLHAAVHRGQALPMILEWLLINKDMMKKPKEDERCPCNVQGEQHDEWQE